MPPPPLFLQNNVPLSFSTLPRMIVLLDPVYLNPSDPFCSW